MNDAAQAQSQQVAKRPSNFEIELQNYEPQIAAVLPDHIRPETFRRILVTAVNQNPELLQADRRSFFVSAVNCAKDGLLPDAREAVLVVFNTKVKRNGRDEWVKLVQYLPMIAGVRKRMRNTGEVLSADAQVIWEKDKFTYRLGDDPMIDHQPAALGQRGKAIGAYAIIKLKNGEVLREVMGVDEIESIRKSAKSKDSPAWANHWGEMARKVVMKRCSKAAPTSAEIDDILRRDDETPALPDGVVRADVAIAHAPPPRPQRLAPPVMVDEGDLQQDAGADETHDDSTPTWAVVDAHGEVREYAEPADAVAAMDKAIADAASRGEGPLDDIWRENAVFLTTLRESNLGDLADKLNEAYGKAADGIKAKAREAASQAEAARKRQQAEADTKPEAPESQNAPAGAQGKPAEGQSAPATQQASAEPPEAQRAPAQRQQRAPTPMKSPLVTKRLSDWPSWVDWVIKLIGNTAPEALDGLHNTYKAEIEELQDFRTADHQRVIEAFDLRRAPPK